MIFIQENTIGIAWLKAIEFIVNGGFNTIYDDKGEILEVIPLVIEITNPPVDDEILSLYANRDYLEFMAHNFQSQQPVDNWGYSYAERLYNFNGVNQIDEVINILKKNPFAKSATISLLDKDNDYQHKPCLVSLDFKIRNQTLLVCAYFRSQDIGKKMYADALELFKIGQFVCSALDIVNISILHLITSAHIYKKDINDITTILDNAKSNKKFMS